jgi:hypothetical protein
LWRNKWCIPQVKSPIDVKGLFLNKYVAKLSQIEVIFPSVESLPTPSPFGLIVDLLLRLGFYVRVWLLACISHSAVHLPDFYSRGLLSDFVHAFTAMDPQERLTSAGPSRSFGKFESRLYNKKRIKACQGLNHFPWHFSAASSKRASALSLIPHP